MTQEAALAKLHAQLTVMSYRIARLEAFCKQQGLDPPVEPIDPNEWLPVKAAAFELGVTPQRIGQLIKAGKLSRHSDACPVLVNTQELRRLLNFRLLKIHRSTKR